ncbi:hypothetical protein AAHA92_25613 [Salvia divinorum]|uniref:Uncharacterized protein n=1 Tax=Salvia divinorum TaxID=28513 RepID=A0ABD1GB68_SALDI
MGSIYRLLLHDKVLFKGITKMENSRAPWSIIGVILPALETAKWQLEDFEREVHMSAFADESLFVKCKRYKICRA